ncbi:GNAT family N-acetyltransferase [Cohnella yongneupensis]|uniref:GNAT family N-acetyltransferase n=1 Tax=Cohnella yongneupensis TaxID=425006 RepID=A0ABW0R5B9_9BACL
MDYIRVTSIEDPYFTAMHAMMRKIFPPEEVLAFELWKEPIADPSIHVYVAVLDGEVVGATEYRYYPELRVAMTDFTIISALSKGIGRFLFVERQKDIVRLQTASGTVAIGMFAEIYNPHATSSFSFGDVLAMHPAVRREVLSHLGYRKLDLEYVHPSWDHEGKAVTELDLSFLPADNKLTHIPAALVSEFLRQYYEALPNKPKEWLKMIAELDARETIDLMPL